MRRLVLVRHGESLWNAEARVQGHSCAGLSALGHRQAGVTATALLAAYPGAHLVTSDLRRTVETAAPFVAGFGRAAREEASLRERSFGAWEGRTPAEIQEAEPERWQRWLDGEDVVAEVGGESAAMLADRVVPTLRRLLDEVPDEGVTIAVSHGGAIHHGIHRLLDLAPGTLGGVANAAVTELVAVGDHVVLDRWNETAHLPVELRIAWQARFAIQRVSRAGR